MRRAFDFRWFALLGLSFQVAACAEGSTLGPVNGGEGGDGGIGNQGGGGGSGGTDVGGGGMGGNPCTEEVCDGFDNDCDGMADEGCECQAGETQSCYSGPANTANVGSCKTGTQTCDGATNTFGPCMGEVLPGTEICNGFDEDCNGIVDDGMPDVSCGVGACTNVVPGCVAGAPGTCVPLQPSPELCDGIDNDCDQLTDETYPEKGQTCNTGQPGVCGAGSSQCVMGVLTCEQTTTASTEQCDGLDNDCNGMVDDNLMGLGAACSTGQLGACSAGTLSCQGGVVDCFPDAPAAPEICDGLDNDCDGTTDENNPGGGSACNTGQMGACGQGTEVCVGGVLLCQSISQGQPETCNGLDDNCNGQIDDGNPGSGLPCSCGGTSNCTNGQILCSGCTKEVHCNNGVNDDGDNKTDCQDADCALGCDNNVSPCAAGETLLVLASTDVPKAIPDYSIVSSTTTFSETATVKRVVLQINVSHSYIADLTISLKSPSNTSLVMSAGNGGIGTAYSNTIFNTSCATPITSGSSPFNGCYAPEQALTGFINQPLKGAWTLTVSDDAFFDDGTLNAWTLAMCVQ